jgi:hypothetical protein
MISSGEDVNSGQITLYLTRHLHSAHISQFYLVFFVLFSISMSDFGYRSRLGSQLDPNLE